MNKIPHPNAAMFKEWIDDTSRNIEYQVRGNKIWMSYTDDIYDKIERFDPVCNWRFSDTVQKAPGVRSGLSDDALLEICNNFWGTATEYRRRLADTAAQEIVTRIMGMDAVTRLHNEVSGGGYSRIQVIDFMNQAIKHFLENLPSALEKTK